MSHHWRASDGLWRVGGGEWNLYDRGRLIGTIQYGRLAGKIAFRGVIRRGELQQVIGYTSSLEQACTEFWNWDVLYGMGSVVR
jgi:hypothetical protein